MKALLIAAAVAAVLSGQALAQENTDNAAPAKAGDAMPQPMDQSGQGGSASTKAFAAVNQKMMTDMAMPMTGMADHDFASMMMVHHQAAIDMAKVELEYGKDKQMRKLAEEIIAAQQKEIATIKKWQSKNPK